MSADQITPERIAELRRWTDAHQHLSPSECREVMDALTASRAEVQRLTEEARRSDAGRVEVPEMGSGDLCVEFFPEDALGNEDVNYRETVKGINAWFRSRLSPSPQPSADVVAVPEGAHCGSCAQESHCVEAKYRVVCDDYLALRSSTNHDSKETL